MNLAHSRCTKCNKQYDTQHDSNCLYNKPRTYRNSDTVNSLVKYDHIDPSTLDKDIKIDPAKDTIQILVCSWFQKSYGNSYFKLRVYINNELIGESRILNGYSQQYHAQIALEVLQQNYYLLDYAKNDYYLGHSSGKYKVLYSCSEVSRERDLKNW